MKRHILFAAFAALLCLFTRAPAQEFISNAPRATMSLSGTWQTAAHNSVNFVYPPPAQGWQDKKVPHAKATLINTPGGPYTMAVRDHLSESSTRTTVRLPGAVADVAAGGAGRFLALYLNTLRKVAIFDAEQRKIVRYISVASDDVYIAAGMDKLVIVLADEGVIQRWNLRSGERELSTFLPGAFRAITAAMGSASQGPVALIKASDSLPGAHGGSVVFFDLKKLQPLEMQTGSVDSRFHELSGQNVRASADGTLFTSWGNDYSPRGSSSAIVSGNTISRRYGYGDVGHLSPAFDGRAIYTAAGVLSPDLQMLENTRNRNLAFIPTYSPAFYLGLGTNTRFPARDGFGGHTEPPPVEVSLYSAGNRRLIVKLVTLDEVGDPMARIYSRDRLPADKRIHFLPNYNLMVTLASARDQLVLRHVDAIAELEKLDVDYLFAQSVPPATAIKGRPFSYQFQVAARHKVTYKVESGPPGMTISDKGLLAWTPPANHADGEESIILSVRDALGQEMFQAFRLKVTEPLLVAQ